MAHLASLEHASRLSLWTCPGLRLAFTAIKEDIHECLAKRADLGQMDQVAHKGVELVGVPDGLSLDKDSHQGLKTLQLILRHPPSGQ